MNPDDFSCKKCGRPVRYASIPNGKRMIAFDARQVKGAGYTLIEVEDEEGPTGEWTSGYTKVADRDPNDKKYRQHDCRPKVTDG